MSLSVDGVWKAGVWTVTVWADGVWREGDFIAAGNIPTNQMFVTYDSKNMTIENKDKSMIVEYSKREMTA